MYEVSTFYKFVSLPAQELASLRESLIAAAGRLEVDGLIILAEEGCNATVAGPPEGMREFRRYVSAIAAFSDLMFKNSSAEKRPFRRFKVDIRPEIVTFDGAAVQPGPGPGQRLDPKAWQHVLDSGEEVVLLDTRNRYETELGKFRGAVDPNIEKFSEFSDFVRNSGIPKERKVLMYCTGGIRCEKASLEMERLGYRNVFQLAGGILKYLEEFPDGSFDGECFVFDHRVAVDQRLRPSQHYRLCPHCGNPADRHISCRNCSKAAIVCKHCTETEDRLSCSKNCAHHLRRVTARALQSPGNSRLRA